MKVSFLVPPSLDGFKPAERSAGCTRVVYPMPNIYELTVAALLEEHSHQVGYHDFVIHQKTERDFNVFLQQHSTDVFCIWSVNLAIETDRRAIAAIRRFHPQAWVVLMGPGPSYFPERYLCDARVVIVRGEPEAAVVNLLDAIENHRPFLAVKGITCLSDVGEIVKTPTEPLQKDLDQYPFPAIHFVEDVVYRNPKLKHSPYMAVVTSRNCPYQCIFCVPSSLTFAREIEAKATNGSKPPIYFRSVENVDRELGLLAQKGYKSIAFVDDNFIWNANRLQGIVDSLNRHGLHWGCQARADAITPQVADILASSSCDYIDLGVESFNDDILKFIRKGLTEAQIVSAIQLLNDRGIAVKLNILIGTSPLETKATIKDTVRKAKQLNASQVMFNIVSPFPGTRFYEMAKEQGWIKSGEYRPTDVQRESILEYPHISAKEMERLLFWSNFSFFIRPSVIFRHLRQFRSMGDFVCALKSFKVKMLG